RRKANEAEELLALTSQNAAVQRRVLRAPPIGDRRETPIALVDVRRPLREDDRRDDGMPGASVDRSATGARSDVLSHGEKDVMFAEAGVDLLGPQLRIAGVDVDIGTPLRVHERRIAWERSTEVEHEIGAAQEPAKLSLGHAEMPLAVVVHDAVAPVN